MALRWAQAEAVVLKRYSIGSSPNRWRAWVSALGATAVVPVPAGSATLSKEATRWLDGLVAQQRHTEDQPDDLVSRQAPTAQRSEAGGYYGFFHPHRVDVLPKPVELLGGHQGGALDGLCQAHVAISKDEIATPSTSLVGSRKDYLTDRHWA